MVGFCHCQCHALPFSTLSELFEREALGQRLCECDALHTQRFTPLGS